MWYDKHRQQHRTYWRKPAGGRDYEAFPTETQARDFIALCKKFGRDKVVARHRGRASGQAATVVAAPATRGGHTIAVPDLAAGLTAPTPSGIMLAWLVEQYVTSGNRGNDNTQSDYRRDLERYIPEDFLGAVVRKLSKAAPCGVNQDHVVDKR